MGGPSKMMSICVREIEAKYKENATMIMAFLVDLDRRGIVKSSMYNHNGHGVERVWSATT
ncbi:MAG: hypothetical protein KGI26_04780 [Thaumarchaeota archaeon]|nr:hypothetical protein [Nitrososphaerota archaeon]